VAAIYLAGFSGHGSRQLSCLLQAKQVLSALQRLESAAIGHAVMHACFASPLPDCFLACACKRPTRRPALRFVLFIRLVAS